MRIRTRTGRQERDIAADCLRMTATKRKDMARRPNDPQRRERILQATLDTIATHGIHAVTHRKIASCAEVR